MEKPTDSNARVVFNLGFNSGVIFIDNVEIEKLADPVWVTGIDVLAGDNEISTYKGTLQCNADVSPGDAYNDSVVWSVTRGSDLAIIDDFGLLTATGDDDGSVTVRATATDGSEVYGETTVTITNQTIGFNEVETIKLKAWIREQQLICDLPLSAEDRQISLINSTGSKVKAIYPPSIQNRLMVSLDGIAPGIYFLEYSDNKQQEIVKLFYSGR